MEGRSDRTVSKELSELLYKGLLQDAPRIVKAMKPVEGAPVLNKESSAEILQNWDKYTIGSFAKNGGSEDGIESDQQPEMYLRSYEWQDAYHYSKGLAQQSVVYGIAGGTIGYVPTARLGRFLTGKPTPVIAMAVSAMAAILFPAYAAQKSLMILRQKWLLYPESPFSNAARQIVVDHAPPDSMYFNLLQLSLNAKALESHERVDGMDFAEPANTPDTLESNMPDDNRYYAPQKETQTAQSVPATNDWYKDDHGYDEVIPERGFNEGKSWDDLRKSRGNK